MRLKFGSFVFDSTTHELTCDGEAVALPPKAYELLGTLLVHRPRALSKAELHKAIWPETFVSDSSLARLVSELRAALGDDSESIRTVHGFGYAFQADAVEAPAIATDPMPTCWLTHGRQVVPLRQGANLIGREPDSIFQIDSAKVSRRHSRILVTSAGATLEDLGSKNGTYLAGVKLSEPATLNDGAQLTIGPVMLTFRSTPDGLSTETELSSRIVTER